MALRYIFVLIGSLALGQACAQTAATVYSTNSASVYVVENVPGNKMGSAVVINSTRVSGRHPYSILTTNCHVVSDARTVIVRNRESQFAADVSYCNKVRDVALLSVSAELPAAKIRLSKTLVIGESIFTIGAPMGFESTVSTGVISQIRSVKDEERGLIQITAPISPGSSGGGLFDAKGNLVGITTQLIRDAQALNFAVPVEWVQEALTQHLSGRPIADARRTNGSPGSNTIISQSEQRTYALKGFMLGEHCRNQAAAFSGLADEGFEFADKLKESTGTTTVPAFCSTDDIEGTHPRMWSRFQMDGGRTFSKGMFQLYSKNGVTNGARYQDNWFPTEGMTPPSIESMKESLRERYGEPTFIKELTEVKELGVFSRPRPMVVFRNVLWIYSRSPISDANIQSMNRARSINAAAQELNNLTGDYLYAIMEERRFEDGGNLQGTSITIRIDRQTKQTHSPLRSDVKL